jgi:alanine dehydrogenase
MSRIGKERAYLMHVKEGVNRIWTDEMMPDFIKTKLAMILASQVKEPMPDEYNLIRPQHTVFTFFHFAGVPGLLDAMLDTKATCIAYETIVKDDTTYPILAPMSKIAGEEAITRGSQYIAKEPEDAIVTIIGSGTVGCAAADEATKQGYKNVIMLDTNLERLIKLSDNGYKTAYANVPNIEKFMSMSHLVIGAVYVNGKQAPKLITQELIETMPVGSCFVDVAIDQGGMTALSEPTTIDDPIIKHKHVNLMCVANMPGRVPEKASLALSDAVLPYVFDILDNIHNKELQRGLSVKNGLKIHKTL